jgi:hypothetical protein
VALINSNNINVTFANKGTLVKAIPPSPWYIYIQVQPSGKFLRIVWPSSGLKFASCSLENGAAYVYEDIQTIHWYNIDKIYTICSREISIICQTSIVNITLIQGIAPLQQRSGKLQIMWDKPNENCLENFICVPRKSLVRINIFHSLKSQVSTCCRRFPTALFCTINLKRYGH